MNTENIRRALQGALNNEAAQLAEDGQDVRAILEAKYGQCWNTKEMSETFSVQGFLAPFVVVVRKSDGVKGSLLFSHSPRFYHSFRPA